MLDNDLARELDDEVAPPVPDTAQLDAIPPDDLDLANRILRRRRRLERDAQGVTDLCAAEVRRINGWRDARLARIQGELLRLEGLLEAFARAAKARSGGKVKSVQLPNGTLKLRAPSSRPRVLVTDADAVRLWARRENRPELLLPPKEPEPSRSDLARFHLGPPAAVSTAPGEDAYEARDPDTGQVVPGVVLVVATADRFVIAAPGDDDE